jgi:hypothetical protein
MLATILCSQWRSKTKPSKVNKGSSTTATGLKKESEHGMCSKLSDGIVKALYRYKKQN